MPETNHVRYIDKTRAYYQAEGYGTPYEWAHFDHTPFTPFASVGKPLSRCRVGVVTTAEMARRDAEPGPEDPRRLVYSLKSFRVARRGSTATPPPSTTSTATCR